ncbi:hypothetical protein PR048_009247, partial [Dryococelus australis]
MMISPEHCYTPKCQNIILGINPQRNFNEALISIEDMCLIMSNKVLSQLGMAGPNRPMHDAFNQELQCENMYDLESLRESVRINLPLLNQQQKYVFDTLMKVVNDGTGGIYFLDAPALKLPLNMQCNETPICNISKHSSMAKVLQQCKLIVWDECTMAHKKSLEALDRTMQDLRKNQNRFGGAMILLAGNFRQTFPVIPRSTPAVELNAFFNALVLRKHVKILNLSKNMHVELQNDRSGDIFSKQLIDIGLTPHNLQLKVGLVIIMLRNINQPRLCNGTWLAVKKLLNNVIEATILKGNYREEDVLIPRIPMIRTDIPFVFKRLQFPVRLAFAMTINKSQGQSLSVCGINLENPCFSHDQLYVACSRVGNHQLCLRA